MTAPQEPPCGHAPTVVGQVFGALEPDDEDRVAEHLAGCPDCRGARDDAQAVVVALAAAVPQLDPPPALRERVLAAARAEPHPARRPVVVPDPPVVSPPAPPTSPYAPERTWRTEPDPDRARRGRTAVLALATAAVVGVILLGVSAILPTQSTQSGADPTTQAARAERIVDGAAAREPGVRHATLRSGDGQPMAVVLDEPTGARVVPVAMTDPGQGRRYVLWSAGPDASAVAVATVDPTAGTTVALPGAAPPPSPRAYAVSVEESGPVPARPTAVVGVGVLV